MLDMIDSRSQIANIYRAPLWRGDEPIRHQSGSKRVLGRDLNIFTPVSMPAIPLPDAPTIPVTPKPAEPEPATIPLPAEPHQDPDGAPASVPCSPSECPHPI